MLPAIFPKILIVKKAPRGRSETIQSLCDQAKIECKVIGQAIDRKVYLNTGDNMKIFREPGSYGAVSLVLPRKSQVETAELALGILAYAVFDYAARESMRGQPASRSSRPLGRPKKARPLSGAERQRRWRAGRPS